MKKLYSTLIAVSTFFLFAALALADPGTTWEKKFGSNRFAVLTAFGGAAVFDKETGRVWERSPSIGTFSWFSALVHCYQLEVGGRKGWRLSTIEELASLVDTSNSSPALPTGHPFTLTSAQEDGFYWSATTFAGISSLAWGVGFFSGNVDGVGKDDSFFVWCVRGGQGIDGVQ